VGVDNTCPPSLAVTNSDDNAGSGSGSEKTDCRPPYSPQHGLQEWKVKEVHEQPFMNELVIEAPQESSVGVEAAIGTAMVGLYVPV
jgi:hypothetical protein